VSGGRKIVLATFGTLGDLHPFIALARALARRGHRPLIATLPDYRERVERAGIAFHPVRPALAQVLGDAGLSEQELARRVMSDARFMFEGLVFRYLRTAYADVDPALEGAALVLTSALAFAARIAAERRGIARMAVVLQPLMFLSAHDPPQLAGASWLSGLLGVCGPRVTAVVLRILKAYLERAAAPIDALRRELGLPGLSGDPLFARAFSAHGTVALYSEHFARAQPDYPPDTLIAGFTFYDAEADASAAAAASSLGRFLASGPPPLVFTLGSFASRDGAAFFARSAEAAARLGRRAVLVRGPRDAPASARETPPHTASGALLWCDYAPYSALFPHAECIVHQGGIGTATQALRAGRPQLVVPFYGDQPDNAARLVRLGVARSLTPRRYTVKRLTMEIETLLANRSYAQRAAVLGRQIADEDGAERAAQLVDRFLA
jgi:rhamnosyltransferase subunit B